MYVLLANPATETMLPFLSDPNLLAVQASYIGVMSLQSPVT